MSLRINKIKSSNVDHLDKYNNQLMKDKIIPDYPSSIILCGSSGSGKTTTLLNILTRKEFYGGILQKKNIFLISATAHADSMFRGLKLPKENIISTNLISNAENIITEREEEVKKKGFKNIAPLCIIFEDITAEKKLSRSKCLIKAFVQNRHLGIITIVSCHKFKSIDRSCRLSANHLILFPFTKSEEKTLIEEFTPPRTSEKEFAAMINYAWSADKTNTRPFLYINMKAPFKTRYRRGFDQIMEI